MWSPLWCPSSFRDRKMSAKKGINPRLTPFLSEDTVIPPVVDVKVQLLCRCYSSTVTKPPDWRTVIWTKDARGDTWGQTKLAHQRGGDNPSGNQLLLPSTDWRSHWPPTQLWEGWLHLWNGAGRGIRWSSDVLGVLNDNDFNGRTHLSFTWLHRPVGL